MDKKNTPRLINKSKLLTGRISPLDISPYSHMPPLKDRSMHGRLMPLSPVQNYAPRNLRIRRVSLDHNTPLKKRETPRNVLSRKTPPPFVHIYYEPYPKAIKVAKSYKRLAGINPKERPKERSAANSPLRLTQRRSSENPQAKLNMDRINKIIARNKLLEGKKEPGIRIIKSVKKAQNTTTTCNKVIKKKVNDKRSQLHIQINNNCANSNISINIVSPTPTEPQSDQTANLTELATKLDQTSSGVTRCPLPKLSLLELPNDTFISRPESRKGEPVEDPQEGLVSFRKSIRTPSVRSKPQAQKYLFLSPRADAKEINFMRFSEIVNNLLVPKDVPVVMSPANSPKNTLKPEVAGSPQQPSTPVHDVVNETRHAMSCPSEASIELGEKEYPSKPVVPSCNSLVEAVACYSAKSRPGMLANKSQKTNQDSYICLKNFACIKNSWLFGVFDGHGVNGHLASNHIKQYLPTNIELIGLAHTNDVTLSAPDQPLEESKTKTARQQLATVISENEKARHLILKDAFIKTDQLIRQRSFKTSFSGSTAVVVLLLGANLVCANTGDSRAILASIKTFNDASVNEFINAGGKIWSVLALSRDHKPDEEDEYRRIIKANGRVDPMRTKEGEPIGPYRVWLKDGKVPGLAMSRSIGDEVAAQVGVISEPEIFEKTLTAEDKFVVIASDGIWEFLPNEKVVELVVPFWEANDPEGACQKLVDVAVDYWECEDEVIDDITVIVVFLSVP